MTPLGRRDFIGGGALAGLSLAFGGGAQGCVRFPRSCPASLPPRFENAAATAAVVPDKRLLPRSAADIIAAVRQAEKDGQRVRMTGSGHSFSDVAQTEDVLLSPLCLDGVLELDRERLKAPGRVNGLLVRVHSGATIRQLNQKLDERGLAFQNLGGFDAQTIVGAACTGTHGSGFAHGPIASQIVSMQLVDGGGNLLQLEPSAGITDAAKGPFHLEEDSEIPLRLIQSDEYFDAVSVGLGCLGVVYAVVLEAAPRFWLIEKRELTSWSALKRRGGFLDRLLRSDELPDRPDHYEVYFNPYTSKGDHTCILTTRFRRYEAPKRTLEDRVRGGLLTVPALSAAIPIDQLGILRELSKHSTLRSATDFCDTALAALRDRRFVDRSYQVFNLGDPNYLRVFGIEVAFDVADTIQATERCFSIAQEQAALGRFHSAPVTLRFVASSKAHLAMQYGRRTSMLEIGMVVGAPGARELLVDYEKHFVSEFGARPHWGLDLNSLQSFDEVRSLYPAADRWLAVYQELNASGRFNGRFTDRLGISLPEAGGKQSG